MWPNSHAWSVAMPQPNRRALIAGTSAALWATSAATGECAVEEEVRETCLRYVAMEDRVLSLLNEWPTLESRLAKTYPNFLGLPLEAQAQFPSGHRFLEIQDELDVAFRLHHDRQEFVPPDVQHRTAGAVIAKLMVVTKLIQPDDHREAHKLVADSVNDLRRFLLVEKAGLEARNDAFRL